MFGEDGSGTGVYFLPFLVINLVAGISFEIKYNIGPRVGDVRDCEYLWA